ncbi:MAG TPA: pentapeptide repeat-containing protein [Oligoflexus sp.]|uniref:pentapeptide repeat-containing protein n=1 Tax=Oligoflexus sp. TaxID=1971216 RepID=UPI002D7F56F8|nr:pentapeptide repeat-containing protein [Oligoflexus sp.]HET9236800.1 pentapeptide repeat-containing protein [Oligoflexus sp.]
MRRTGTIWLMAGFIYSLTACNKAAPLTRTANDLQSVVDAPSTDAKTDRPTETGEGLPGYLIDPAKLAIETQDNLRTIVGSAAAVRSVQGPAASLRVLLIRVDKRSAKFQKNNQDWTLNGSQIVAVQADVAGAFKIQGSITADELLFLKLEDSAGAQIHYRSTAMASSVLWIEGNAAQPLDADHAAQISAQVTAAQSDARATEVARLIEQLKTTGQCRNCNLAGADLSGLEIVSCDLSFSNLMAAKFVLANLASCNFTNSNLSQADFTQANLAGANLTQTDLSGAVFTGANTDGVVGTQIPRP